MNPKIKKINGEIEKAREKLSEIQSRVRELERQRTEIENADIVSLVRSVSIPIDALETFIRSYTEQKGILAPETPIPEKYDSAKEDSDFEK